MNTTTTQPRNTLLNSKIIAGWFLAVLLALATLQSCSTSRNGCKSTRGMSGYSHK